MPAPELADQHAQSGARPLHILLVEDNDDDAFLLERHLAKNGFVTRIDRVETAAEMLRLLAPAERAGLPELILADYNLPNFSGPEALQILKASGFDIPFIMLSGAMSETTAVESMRAGAQDYVTKQNLARLIPAVERELREVGDRRKKVAAERALAASEDRFHRLVEAMPLGLLISDARGKVLYTNAAAKSLFGLEGGAQNQIAPIEITFAELCPGIDAQPFFSTVVPAQETFETSCRSRSAELPFDALIGLALLNPGDAPAERQIAAFVADLTLQKKNEELLRRTEKLAVAGRLAASIAHEINNPLEAVTNLLYLIGTSPLRDDAREYLGQAMRELDRVAQITVQTLRFHRRSSRAVETDVKELVESVLPLFEGRARLLQATVERRFRAVPPVLIHDGEVRQVVANLVSNATDALGERGRLLVRIAAGRHSRSGVAGVTLTVADSGCGMSRETIERIFEPFFSTKGATGTGLGLWVSLEIVEKHHGSLRVRSRKATPERAGGTVFRFFLPVGEP